MKKIVLVGKSGSGKDYAADLLKEKGFKIDVSNTTRPKREGEIEGETYNYLTEEEFNKYEYYERVEFNGWKYGTTSENWNNCNVFIMTPGGVKHISEEDRDNCHIIYFDILESTRRERISKRSDADSVERRIEADRIDFKDFNDWDRTILNEEFTLEDVLSNYNLEHLMLDIETLGNKGKSVILSIGAVEFDLETGITGKEFHKHISIESCLEDGLQIDADTLMWWFGQDKKAKDKIVNSEKAHLTTVLYAFEDFVINKGYQVWGNSARFDCGELQNAYNVVNGEIPWDFRKERDVRTLVSFAPEVKKNFKFEGVPHDALDDCKHQIGYCVEIWNKIMNYDKRD